MNENQEIKIKENNEVVVKLPIFDEDNLLAYLKLEAQLCDESTFHRLKESKMVEHIEIPESLR